MTFESIGIEINNKTSGLHKTTCPQCSEERKNKKDKCLSVNISEGIYNCHNCGWKGTTKEYKKMEKKNYTIPQKNNTELSDKTLDWFLKRGISKSTIIRFGISESSEYISQVSAQRNCINFNYFRNDKLVNVKFRDAEKNFKMVTNAELIFYGLDLIKDCSTIVICEGEIDALSFYESGVHAVVSVPNGASKGSQKLDYLDNCYEYFKDKNKVILATDNDEPGIALREELARRLGKERCFIFQYPEGCKDANEILVKGGSIELSNCMKYVIPYPMDGVETVESLINELDDFFNNDYPEGLKIGIKEFDNLISYVTGQLTTITGIPGSGKTEVLNFIQMMLAIKHGWKFAIFSPENPTTYHFKNYAEIYTGKAWKINNSEHKMSYEEFEKAKEFINNHFYWIKVSENDLTAEGLLQKGKEMILRYGINSMSIDPYNYIEHKIPKGYSETQYISEVLTSFKRFAAINNVHLFLVAHPTKIQKDTDGKYKVPTLYDIAGSAHFFNKTDNGLVIYRDFQTNNTTVYVQKIRFNWMGKLGSTDIRRDPYNSRYYGIKEEIL